MIDTREGGSESHDNGTIRLGPGRGHPYLLAEADRLVETIAGNISLTKTLCVASAAVVFAVVGLTGALLGSGTALEERYAWLSAAAVICGAVAEFGGFLAIFAFEGALEDAKYLRTQLDYQDRAGIERTKALLEKAPKRLLTRAAFLAAAWFSSIGTVAAVFAYLEAVF